MIWILGTISGLLLIYGAMCLSLAGGYSAMGPCLGPPMGMCPGGAGPSLVTVSLPLNSDPIMFAVPILALAFLTGLPVWIRTPIRAERRRASAHMAILIVSLCASALLMVDLIIILSEMSLFGGSTVCLASVTGQASACFSGMQGLLLALVGVGWAPVAGAVVAGAPAWVMALTQTARWRQWGWFVAALLFSPVAALLYAFFGSSSRPASTAPISPASPQEPAPAI